MFSIHLGPSLKYTAATRVLFALLLTGCQNAAHREQPVDYDLELANQLIDAFYSFDSDSLATVLATTDESRAGVLYYQQWAACGHYKVVTRSGCIKRGDSLITCPVTVEDDLMGALQIKFNVTDSFHIKVIDGQIRSVETSSNDPEIYYEAKEWVKVNRPELVEVPCEGIWEDGPTPCECVQGMVKGFREFVATLPQARHRVRT